MIIALILALALGGGGTVAAAQNDLPGDALYGVKLASERVAEQFTARPEAKVKLEARFAERRAVEIGELKARVRAKAEAEGKTEAEVAPKFEEHMTRAAEHMTRQIERTKTHIAALKAKDAEGALRAAAVLEAKVEIMEDKLATVTDATSQEDLKAKLQAAHEKAKELRTAFEKAQDEAADEDGLKGRDEQSAAGRVGAAENKLAALARRRAAILEKISASGDAESKAQFEEQDKFYHEAVKLVTEAKAALAAKDWKLAWDKANAAFKAMVQFHPPMLKARVRSEVKEEMPEKVRAEIKEEVKERLKSVTPEVRAKVKAELKERLEARTDAE